MSDVTALKIANIEEVTKIMKDLDSALNEVHGEYVKFTGTVNDFRPFCGEALDQAAGVAETITGLLKQATEESGHLTSVFQKYAEVAESVTTTKFEM